MDLRLEQSMNQLNHTVFDTRLKRPMNAEVFHGSAAFISSLFQDAFRGNIGEDFVTVACNPDLSSRQFLVETDGVINYGFSAEPDECQIISELNHLGRERIRVRNGALLLELFKQVLCQTLRIDIPLPLLASSCSREGGFTKGKSVR